MRTFFKLASGYVRRACPRYYASDQSPPLVNDLGLPLSPPWSVRELIGSYASPALSDADIIRLHDFAALVPPHHGSSEFERLKRDMEELVKLVEAVKMLPDAHSGSGRTDIKTWVVEEGLTLDRPHAAGWHKGDDKSPFGQTLLEHSQKTKNGFYLVDADRRRKT